MKSKRKRGRRPFQTNLLPPKIESEARAWIDYRMSEASDLKRCSRGTAEREAKLLLYAASEASRSTQSITDLMLPKEAARVLNKQQYRLKSKDLTSWGSMTYETARTFSKIAASNCFPSLGYPAIPKEQVKQLSELKTRYSPKGTDVPLYLPDVLRPFTSSNRADDLTNLASGMVASLPTSGRLSCEQKKTLGLAFSLQLAIEMPESSSFLATLTLSHLEVSHRGGRYAVKIFRNVLRSGEPIGDLSPVGVAIYREYKLRVLDDVPRSIFLFAGSDGAALPPSRFRCRIRDLTKTRLKLKKGLSVRTLRWVIAFIHLARGKSRDLVAKYLAQTQRDDLEPLLRHFEGWRRSGALSSYAEQVAQGAPDNDK